jgi:hypothetical protein
VGDDVEVGLMSEFHPLSGGGVRIVLDADEARVLRGLATELRSVLTGAGPADDPVIERLFPAAYDDPIEEESYRDMVAGDLEQEKIAGLDAVASALHDDGEADVSLGADDVGGWLATLTDLRLALGIRLGVDEERMGAEVDPSAPDAAAMTVLHWLGWVQEGIIHALQAS